MRRFVVLPCTVATMVTAATAPAAAEPSTGGASAPSPGVAPSKDAGGTPYAERSRGKRRRPAAGRRRPRPAGPVLASFTLRDTRLFLYGRPARLSFRITSRARLAAGRISITPKGARRAVATIGLASLRRGREESVPITGRETAILPEGAYRVRISARDVRGRPLRRGAGISSTSDLWLLHHRSPLGGPFTYGGADARFGAARDGHTHQGQDLSAAEGTPVLAPRGGLVKAVQYQASGAGHYVVLDGAGEQRDYVFMHLRTGSIPVREGQTVRTGQLIGAVGNTGRSFGAHLHFEIWDGGGWYSGGKAVDPLPLLREWDRLTRSAA